MEKHTISTADYLDILFDNRNKEYGGYVLRKQYERRMTTGLLLVVGCAGLLSALTFFKKQQPVQNDRIISCPLTPIPPPVILQPRPKPPIVEQPAAPKVKPTAAFTVPVIKNDAVVDPAKPVEDPGDKDPGKTTTEGDPNGSSTLTNGTGTTVPIIPAEPAITTPVFIAEVMPAFDGDINAYLNRHTHYPEPARENHIQGKVIVQFVVDENGQVTAAKIMRGIGGGCNEEALRVVRSMPKWKPGKQNGRAVKVYFTLPIHFVLQ